MRLGDDDRGRHERHIIGVRGVVRRDESTATAARTLPSAASPQDGTDAAAVQAHVDVLGCGPHHELPEMLPTESEPVKLGRVAVAPQASVDGLSGRVHAGGETELERRVETLALSRDEQPEPIRCLLGSS
jgi:hypothetical protein